MLNFLYFYICAFLSACAVPSMAVVCGFLISLFPGKLLMYFLSDFEIIPDFLKFTGKNFVLTFYVRCISLANPMYFKLFSASFYYCHCHYYYTHFLHHSSLASSQKSTGLTPLSTSYLLFRQNFLTIQHVLSTTNFGIRIHRARRILGSFKVSCNLFEIAVVDCTIGII
jgi:hypothetical protein